MKQVKIDEDIFIDICIYMINSKDLEAKKLKNRLKPKISAYIRRSEYIKNNKKHHKA